MLNESPDTATQINPLPPDATEWQMVLRQTGGQTTAQAVQLPAKEFPYIEWPGAGWRSGACIFFDAGAETEYEEELRRLLCSDSWALAYERVMGPRFDAARLQKLTCQAPLYLYADSLAMPESSDPWYFLPRAFSSGEFLKVAGNCLAESGCDIFLSRRISEYLPWIGGCRLPSDATELASAGRLLRGSET